MRQAGNSWMISKNTDRMERIKGVLKCSRDNLGRERERETVCECELTPGGS